MLERDRLHRTEFLTFADLRTGGQFDGGTKNSDVLGADQSHVGLLHLVSLSFESRFFRYRRRRRHYFSLESQGDILRFQAQSIKIMFF